MPSYSDIYKLSQDLTNAFHTISLPRWLGMSAPKQFPPDPSSMDAEWLAHAYDADDPPVKKKKTFRLSQTWLNIIHL